MRSRAPFPFLVTGLGVTLALYHLECFHRGRYFDVRDGWERSELRLKHVGAVSVPVRRPSPFRSVDGAMETLRDAGYRLHFGAGRLPDYLLAGRSTPVLSLYTRGDIRFQYAPAAAEWSDSAFRAEARRFAGELTAKGVHVVIVPVPTKISMERERLPKRLPAEDPWQQGRTPRALRDGEEAPYAVYREALALAPGHTVDLYRRFAEHKAAHADDALFAPAATHWSTLGMALAAETVIERLRRLGVRARAPGLRYENKLAPEYGHDLLRTLLLPERFLATDARFRWFEPVYEIPPVVDGGNGAKIVIAGSCNTRRHMDGFGFGTLLQQALGYLYVDASLDFASSIEPLWEVAKQELALFPGDVLVWEFSVRNPPPRGARLPSLRVTTSPARAISRQPEEQR